MLLKSLGLRVHITDAAGTPLTEYQEKQSREDSIECWIPSTEGANFEIHWEILEGTPPTAGCCSCATPYFDGIKLKSKGTATGESKGKLYGHPVGPTSIRLYQFGRRAFTDEEDTSLSSTVPLEDLGTIRLRIDWGQFIRKEASFPRRFTDPTPGPVHEKLSKKGFWDSAVLGQTTYIRQPAFGKFIKKEGTTSGNFLFRYASEDLLHAKGIIPQAPKSELSTKLDPSVKPDPSNASICQKRARSATPEVTGADGFKFKDGNGGISAVHTKRHKS